MLLRKQKVNKLKLVFSKVDKNMIGKRIIARCAECEVFK